MLQTIDEQIFKSAVQQLQPYCSRGIFLSFWLHVPRTTLRGAFTVHIALHRQEAHPEHESCIVGTLIPINYFPLPGTNPPRVPDLVMPHAVATYVARKLHRMGISKHAGFISERHVDRGRSLTAHTRYS